MKDPIDHIKMIYLAKEDMSLEDFNCTFRPVLSGTLSIFCCRLLDEKKSQVFNLKKGIHYEVVFEIYDFIKH